MLILGGFNYCHHCLNRSFFQGCTIIITYNYIQINKACGIFTILKIWCLPTDYIQRWFFLIKTIDRWWTLLVYLNRMEQRPNNIVMISKHWNNQYCYNRLILENSTKITKIKIMRWQWDKRWLYEWCNDYTTIDYQIIINEKAKVIEIKTKMIQWY